MQWSRIMDTEATRAPAWYRIVIALDGSEYSEIVLEHALDQAARHDAPDLHVLTVVEDERTDPEATKQWLATLVLEGLESFRAGRPGWRTRLHVRVGKPEEEIPNLAAEIRADLLVIGRYGVHRSRGSVADRVIPMAVCPTLVVGLTDHPVESVRQCADCVAVREQTDGERWFCDSHTSPDRFRLTTLVPSGSMGTKGGSVW